MRLEYSYSPVAAGAYYSSPVAADGKIYLRTQSALYCFAKKD